jgi:hypothetical protein
VRSRFSYELEPLALCRSSRLFDRHERLHAPSAAEVVDDASGRARRCVVHKKIVDDDERAPRTEQ